MSDFYLRLGALYFALEGRILTWFLTIVLLLALLFSVYVGGVLGIGLVVALFTMVCLPGGPDIWLDHYKGFTNVGIDWNPELPEGKELDV